MNIYSISSIMAFSFCVVLAILINFRDRGNPLNSSFALITFLAGVWSLYPFLSMNATDPTIAILYVRGVYFAAVFVPSTFLKFVFALIRRPLSKREEMVLFFSYLVSSVLFGLNFTPLLVKSLREFSWGFFMVPGQAYYFYTLFFGFICFYAFIKLIIAFRQSKGIQKQQLKCVFLAFIFAYVSGLMHFSAVYIGPQVEIFPHDLLLIVFAGTIAYSIIRHHLLDIEIVIKRGLVYSLLTGLITGIFVSLIFVGNYFFSGLTGYNPLLSGVIGGFVISLIFQPLRDAIQTVVDRTFFRARYNYQQILSKYSHTLAQPMADLNRFSRIAPYLITKSMKLSGSSVMVLDRESHNYLLRAGEREAQQLEGTVVSDDSALIKELMKQHNGFSLEEISELEKTASGKEKQHYQEIMETMNKLKSVLIIPSISEGQYFHKPTLLSTINLGRKMSDESFSREDVEFLRTLANQASISIEYAFMLEELQKNQQRVVQSEKLATIGTTTAGVAHELKNPLTYLHTLGQILPSKWQDKEFMESVIKLLPAETQRMQLIVEGLLDYSRSRELMLKPLDVSTVTDKGLALLTYEIRKQRIEVKTNYDHKCQALGDPNRLMQVFMNVIANAVQAMGQAGGNLTITTLDEDNWVVVKITDTGPGMSREQQKKIFDSFFTTKEGGTGLGLPISKKIVEEHHGTMEVESAEGKGTTFTISLPAAAG